MFLFPDVTVGLNEDRAVHDRQFVAEKVLGDLDELRLAVVCLDDQRLNLGFVVNGKRAETVGARDESVAAARRVRREADGDRIDEPMLDDALRDGQRVLFFDRAQALGDNDLVDGDCLELCHQAASSMRAVRSRGRRLRYGDNVLENGGSTGACRWCAKRG